mmetsp:Transcript_3887/g.7473  ORF Transcript_3887/g.7473 Transcript_3887/m.7473 type:complete len:218 (+) Transcript_3887:678-1331(+)
MHRITNLFSEPPLKVKSKRQLQRLSDSINSAAHGNKRSGRISKVNIAIKLSIIEYFYLSIIETKAGSKTRYSSWFRVWLKRLNKIIHMIPNTIKTISRSDPCILKHPIHGSTPIRHTSRFHLKRSSRCNRWQSCHLINLPCLVACKILNGLKRIIIAPILPFTKVTCKFHSIISKTPYQISKTGIVDGRNPHTIKSLNFIWWTREESMGSGISGCLV